MTTWDIVRDFRTTPNQTRPIMMGQSSPLRRPLEEEEEEEEGTQMVPPMA
jgi:hypothetical protein